MTTKIYEVEISDIKDPFDMPTVLFVKAETRNKAKTKLKRNLRKHLNAVEGRDYIIDSIRINNLRLRKDARIIE